MLEINNDEKEKPIENTTLEEDMAALEQAVAEEADDDAIEIAESPEPNQPPTEENLATESQLNEKQATEDQKTDNETAEDQTMEDPTAENPTTENAAMEIAATENTENPAIENPKTENPETEKQATENQGADSEPAVTVKEEIENNEHNNKKSTLNPLNEPEPNADPESKSKNRRYWTPREEEKFYEIWGRENWRLTRHGKNTLYFAKWAEEMKASNFDIKPEEVQCKVNQTRAKFRQVKKHIEQDRNYVKWKKYDIVEKILKNQYRSKDDEPVPLEALENNRDVSPTEMLNSNTQPGSPNSTSNMSTIPEQGINLSQSGSVDLHLADEINMSNVSLSDQNLLNNNSQSGNNFSTELFGGDQFEIKKEIETDIKLEGFISEIPDGGTIDGIETAQIGENQSNSQLHQQLTQPQQTIPQQQQQVPLIGDITNNNIEQNQILIPNHNPNSLLLNNRLISNNAIVATSTMDGILNINNHALGNNINTMQPPKTMLINPSPRKRNRTPTVSSTVAAARAAEAAAAAVATVSESLESQYLEETRKRNILLVEQGEINRKRLCLEERKVKLMEDFFPKFMNLQHEILQKLDTVTNPVREAINMKIDD